MKEMILPMEFYSFAWDIVHMGELKGEKTKTKIIGYLYYYLIY